MRPIRIERRELHGQMVDVAVYGPGPAPGGWTGWTGVLGAEPRKASGANQLNYRSMNTKAFQNCLLAGNTRGLSP